VINDLKSLTEKNIGFKIKSRGDCHILSDLITSKTDKDINYNTLRRFFGLDKPRKPQQKTLDILSEFNGFKSFADFSNRYPIKFSWKLREEIYEKLNLDSNEGLISYLNTLSPRQYDLIDTLVIVLRELLLRKDYETIKLCFNLDIFNPKNFQYSELLYLGNSIGLIMRKHQYDYSPFVETKHFAETVFTTFVDYSSLNKNYGVCAKKVFCTTTNNDLKLFSGLVVQLIKVINNKPVSFDFDHLVNSKTHPILIGRYLSLKIHRLKKDKVFSLLEQFKTKFQSKSYTIDYVYELMFFVMLTKNFVVMEWITLNFKSEKIISRYYREWHYSILILVELILKIYHNKVEGLESKLVTLTNVKPRYSYDSFFRIFMCVVQYHLKIEPSKQLKTYNSIKRSLEYPIFDEDYCKNYFSS